MTSPEAVKECFKKYATFSWRAPRSEYWWFMVFLALGYLGIAAVDGSFSNPNPAATSPLATFFTLTTLLPTLAVTSRRLHDIGMSGWWQMAPSGLLIIGAVMAMMEAYILFSAAILAAMASIILLLAWTIRKGSAGANRFGPDPLTDAGDSDAGGGYSRSSVPKVRQ